MAINDVKTTYRPRVELYNPKYTSPSGYNPFVPTISRDRRTPGGLLDNYIYFYHLPSDNNTDIWQFAILPTYPESFTDRIES